MEKNGIKTIYRILIALLGLAVCAEIGLLIWGMVANNGAMREVTLEQKGETVEELSFSAENFLPGEVKEYTILLHGDAGGEFDVTFTANPSTEGTLWQYLDFEIVYEEQSKAAPLADLFGGTEFQFDVTMGDVPAKFTVRYKMPKEVGNEAENLGSDFSLTLSAKRK